MLSLNSDYNTEGELRPLDRITVRAGVETGRF